MKAKSIISVFLTCLMLTGDTQQLHAQIPSINSIFPLNTYVGSLVNIKGSNMHYTASVKFNGTTELIISITDTLVVVMIMPGTASGTDNRIIAMSGGSSIYAGQLNIFKSIPPTKQLGDKLIGQSSTASSPQGSGVAISADGNTAVVGAGSGTGGVFVYIRSNNIWTQQGDKLVGTGAADGSLGSDQGYSVAISADGNTIIDGGVGDNGFTGASWIFVRDKNNIWSQQGNKLVGSNSIIIGNATPEQGYAVSISADGNTAIIGGRRDSNNVGAAWVFTRSNNVWTEQQKLIGTGYINIINEQGFLQRENVQMGSSVDISADGNTVLIGGPNDNKDTGAVWVFARSGNTFIQQGSKLVGTGGNASYLHGMQRGTSVALSADGNTAIIGAPFDSDSTVANNFENYANGAAWIFTRNGNTWSQQGNKLFATDASEGAEQGWSVSMSADGNTAIVGAPTDSGYVGGSWVYTRTNNVWKQSSNKLLGTGYLASPKQGWSVGISADGNTAIIGGPDNNPLGAAWVYADTSNIILPVTLANFKAYLFGKGIQTSWTGFNEINMSSYDVERSNNSYHFNKLANVPAKPNKGLQNNYAWFDASPFAGNNFYRIKAISNDGSIQYSSIAKVNITNNQSNIQVYPNPADGKAIHLQLNNITAGNYIISIYNTGGETLYRQSFQHAGGNASIPINLKNTAAGMYHVELKNSSNNYHTTVILR